MRIRPDHPDGDQGEGFGAGTDGLTAIQCWVCHSSCSRGWGRPTVVANLRIVRPQSSDELDLDPNDLAAGGVGAFPEDLLADGEVPPLLRGEVLLDKFAIDAAEVGQGVRHV